MSIFCDKVCNIFICTEPSLLPLMMASLVIWCIKTASDKSCWLHFLNWDQAKAMPMLNPLKPKLV
jgi:hypothetical protein